MTLLTRQQVAERQSATRDFEMDGCLVPYSPPTYGYVMTFSRAGHEFTVEVEGLNTPQQALRELIRCARALGWSPPKWWQWWRWKEVIRADPFSQDAP